MTVLSTLRLKHLMAIPFIVAMLSSCTPDGGKVETKSAAKAGTTTSDATTASEETAPSCVSGYSNVSGTCILTSQTRACLSQPANSTGGGQMTVNAGSTWGACTGFSCNSGFVLTSGACVSGSSGSSGSCSAGYTSVSGVCTLTNQTRACATRPANSTGGTQSTTNAGVSWSACSGYSCTATYTNLAGVCTVTNQTRTCAPQPANSTGGTQSSTNAGVSWGACTAFTCSASYTNVSGICTLTNQTRTCVSQPTNSSGGTQATTNGGVSWGACSGFTCSSGYTSSGGSCVASGGGTGTSSSYTLTAITEYEFPDPATDHIYEPRGVGGGGAMSGFSISPYSSLWFVGTDMGTLFRSINRGASWTGVNHVQTGFSSTLEYAVGVGFSADPEVVFHAPAGREPLRSTDAGVTWSKITSFALATDEHIRYWRGHSYDANYMYAGTDKGLWQSRDNGVTWAKLSGISGSSKGTYIDYATTGHVIYHATATAIFKSTNQGTSFSSVHTPAAGIEIRAFTAGRDATKITFAYIDNNGRNACAAAAIYANDWGATSMNAHYDHCGYVWTGVENMTFTRTSREAGDHIKMAENDSNTIVTTGSTSWIRQYGSKVWKSSDAGSSWTLKLNQLNWDVTPFAAWPQSKIEYSAAAMDIGWHDGGYESFDMHLRSPSIMGGTGYYFLHTSVNGGENWKAPFTIYADTGTKAAGKKWKSTGLEVTSVYKFKFHPTNPQIGYAAMADMAGMVTEDGGSSFRITKAAYNSNYDYAFDPDDDTVAYAASGSQHDYPMQWHASVASGDEGGIYKTSNKGLTWTRITPNTTAFNRQFLAVGYDNSTNTIYGGMHGSGLARSVNGGAWALFNTGLPASDKIISQIEVDPNTGGVYILLAGDAPTYSNTAATGIYYLAPGGTSWTLLRTNVARPSGVSASYALWNYPTGFAVDFSSVSGNNPASTLWLIDMEMRGAWLASGIWKSTDRGVNWARQTQYTHPLSITVDQANPNNVYVNGLYQVDGDWGNGGLYYTTNGGSVWKKNTTPAYQSNGRSATIDPNDRTKLFYTFFGSAMLYGPRPN